MCEKVSEKSADLKKYDFISDYFNKSDINLFF